MVSVGCLGSLLIIAGPLASVYCATVMSSSFTILYSIACMFYWLAVLFGMASILVWFEPSPSLLTEEHTALFHSEGSPLMHSMRILVVAMVFQEIGRYGSWVVHDAVVNVLGRRQGSPLVAKDVLLLAITQGLSHAIVHATVFSGSWIPLLMGGGTLYNQTCPQMSVFTVGAVSMLAMSSIITLSTMHSHAAMAMYGAWSKRMSASGVHCLAACITLLNLVQGGCVVSVPLLCATAVAYGTWVIKQKLYHYLSS